MGVGDRHSKRLDKAQPAGSNQRAYVVDERELDDPFSAWDADDAGAQPPDPSSQRAQTTSSLLDQTRNERRAAVAPPAASSLFSPTTPRTLTPPSYLAAGSSQRPTPLGDSHVDPDAARGVAISRVRTLDDPFTTQLLAEIARNEAARTSDKDPPTPDIALPRRRTRRSITRDEPFRKK
jgi:hypothetical protein